MTSDTAPVAALGWVYDRIDHTRDNPAPDVRTLVRDCAGPWGMADTGQGVRVLSGAADELVPAALRRGVAAVTIYRTTQGWACLSVGSDGGFGLGALPEEPTRPLRDSVAAAGGRLIMEGDRMSVLVPIVGQATYGPDLVAAIEPVAVGGTFDLITLSASPGMRVWDRLRAIEAPHVPVTLDVRSRRLGFLIAPEPCPSMAGRARRWVCLPSPPGVVCHSGCRWLSPPLRGRVGERSVLMEAIEAVGVTFPESR